METNISDFYYGSKIAKMIADSKKNETVRHYFQYTGEDSGYFYNVLPGAEAIHCITQFQDLKILDTIDFGRCLLLDDKMMLSTVEEHEYHELIIHPACLQLKSFENALILGGGDCFSARTLLQYPVKHVDMIEIDEVVVQACREYFAEQIGHVFEDPRFTIFYKDATSFTSDRKYDYVALDLTDPDETTNLSLSLYSESSLRHIKSNMTEKSILSIQAGCPIYMPVMFQETLTTLKGLFKYVTAYGKYISMYGGFQYFIYCSDEYDVANPDFTFIQENLSNLNLGEMQTYSPEYHDLLLKEFNIHTNKRSKHYAEVESKAKLVRQANLLSKMTDTEINSVIDQKALPSLITDLKNNQSVS